MRRSLRTNTLVIVSDPTKSLYEDQWIGDVFHYTGMGKCGDQSLDFAQNKTLYHSNTNGVTVYLFEVYEKGKYTFRGPVKLIDTPYQQEQLGEDKVLRNVWIFPLKLVNSSASQPIPESSIRKIQEAREKIAQQLSDEDLLARAKSSSGKASKRTASTTVYERDEFIAELAKRNARGICQLCDQSAPFVDKKNKPYLEVHHIIWLSKGGNDSIENTVALCPNCHRKMHALNLDVDVQKLRNKVSFSLNPLNPRRN
ncbi:HNH endonuclease [Heliobacillus mobilis]|uniref:HNH endonuclease n=2 Tax=Heliobacterium mobile TaxID=28064 RepID=A0A6I3SG38_HELMO|nr:HNH endonuclease [Heliobacterium mobile]